MRVPAGEGQWTEAVRTRRYDGHQHHLLTDRQELNSAESEKRIIWPSHSTEQPAETLRSSPSKTGYWGTTVGGQFSCMWPTQLPFDILARCPNRIWGSCTQVTELCLFVPLDGSIIRKRCSLFCNVSSHRYPHINTMGTNSLLFDQEFAWFLPLVSGKEPLNPWKFPSNRNVFFVYGGEPWVTPEFMLLR